MKYPFDRTWWIEDDKLLGGRYPGTPSREEQARMLGALIDAGVRLIINLQEPLERGRGGRRFRDYEPILQRVAQNRGVAVEVSRFPISDQTIPQPQVMREILDQIDATIAAGKRVYVHCWGGSGRTGVVAGCWLDRKSVV